MFLAELPTTGAISFTDFCADPGHSYTVQLAEATQARANLRAALKESKRTDGEKDYLRLVKVLDDYLPHLCGIIACVAVGDLTLVKTPVFSWRTTLSANLLNQSPRLDVPTLYADLTFSLLTYGFALSNLARATVQALGSYEHDASLPETQRKAHDERLNFAVTLLCKASGVFQHITDSVIGEWEAAAGSDSTGHRPPELTREVNTALAKMTLSDAQSLAIRKLMSKAAAEIAISPGPPLPRTHPSPGLLAKLHLEAASLYTSARALAKTPAAASQRSKISLPGKDKGADEVAGELRRYLAGAAALHGALGHKWLGVEAGESKAGAQTGIAIGYLEWALRELSELRDGGGKGIGGSDRDRAMRDDRKDSITKEIASVNSFLGNYKTINNTLSLQAVPSQSELQATIPAGRLAVSAKAYQLPTPAFGPGSLEYIERRAQALEIGTTRDEGTTVGGATPSRGYAGAGEYF